jgi:hypothetical protein
MIIQAKIEYVKNDPTGDKWHVYKRTKGLFNFFTSWDKSECRKTLQEAEEKVKSLGDTVQYLGIFENGVRKGTMAWDDNKANKPAPKPLDLPDTEEIDYDRLPKKR